MSKSSKEMLKRKKSRIKIKKSKNRIKTWMTKLEILPINATKSNKISPTSQQPSKKTNFRSNFRSNKSNRTRTWSTTRRNQFNMWKKKFVSKINKLRYSMIHSENWKWSEINSRKKKQNLNTNSKNNKKSKSPLMKNSSSQNTRKLLSKKKQRIKTKKKKESMSKSKIWRNSWQKTRNLVREPLKRLRHWQLWESPWPEKHPQQWQRSEKQEKSWKSRNYLFWTLLRSTKKQNSN